LRGGHKFNKTLFLKFYDMIFGVQKSGSKGAVIFLYSKITSRGSEHFVFCE